MSAETHAVIRYANRAASRLEADIGKLRAELSSMAESVKAAGQAGHFVNWHPAYRRAAKVLRETRLPKQKKAKHPCLSA